MLPHIAQVKAPLLVLVFVVTVDRQLGLKEKFNFK
jgi:hypothetical protein